MSQNSDADGGIDFSNLFVYAGPEQAALSDMTVYESGVFDVLEGRNVHARIIGSSHYIEVPSIPYREVTSCRPIDMVADFDPVLNRYSIPEGVSDAITRSVGPYEVSISVMTLDGLEDFNPDSWDLAYTFEGDGPSAPTAIDFREDGWESIHAYPEYECGLYTLTEFERR